VCEYIRLDTSVMSHVWIQSRHNIYGPCQTSERVMSHTRLSRITRVTQSCHTHGFVTSLTNMGHDTHINLFAGEATHTRMPDPYSCEEKQSETTKKYNAEIYTCTNICTHPRNASSLFPREICCRSNTKTMRRLNSWYYIRRYEPHGCQTLVPEGGGGRHPKKDNSDICAYKLQTTWIHHSWKDPQRTPNPNSTPNTQHTTPYTLHPKPHGSTIPEKTPKGTYNQIVLFWASFLVQITNHMDPLFLRCEIRDPQIRII